MPWKWRHFKDKNTQSRSPITSVICQDRHKWIHLIEKIIFYFTILLWQRSNFPRELHPSTKRQLHPSYFLKNKESLEPSVVLEGFPYGNSATKSHQQIITPKNRDFWWLLHTSGKTPQVLLSVGFSFKHLQIKWLNYKNYSIALWCHSTAFLCAFFWFFASTKLLPGSQGKNNWNSLPALCRRSWNVQNDTF